MNHTNTSTGKLSGWGSWWDVPNAGAATTSYTIGGLANGKEYRFKLRAVNSAGESKPGPQSAPWYVTAWPQKPPPPAAPSNVAVNPGNDSLQITWDAVSGATGYDVRAKAEGSSSWHGVASNVTGTSYTYNTSNTMDYVGVRARNANGASAWIDVSRMPADDLLNVATGLSSGGASAQSVQGQSQLAAPTWGTIELGWEYQTRTTLRAELDLNWTGSSGATGYNLVCSDTERGGWDWYICGWVDATNSNTVTYTSVPTAQSQPVTVSHYRRTSANFHPPGDYHLVYGRAVAVAIRAVNANPADASAWATTPIIRNVLPDLSNFTATRTDDQLSMSWTPNKWTTGYKVYCDTYTAGQTPSYTLCATLTNQDDTAASHSVTITKSGGTHDWPALDNTSILDLAIDSTNGWDTGRFVAPLIYPITLTASNVGATTATLTIANHNAAWYYKYTVPATPAGTCSTVVAAGTTTATLDTLTAGTAYTFKAYSDSSCTTELATETFTTPASLTASKVGDTTATLTIAGHSEAWYYKANAAPDNTCQGPVNAGTKTKDLTSLSGNTTYTYEAYSDSACTTANKLATALAFITLSSASTMGSTSSGDEEISVNKRQAVAFTTGNDSAATGYVLKSITVPLKAANPSGGRDGLQLKLYAMTGTYSTTSAPSGNALATLSGTAPTSSTYVNTTWTCSGSGCNLSKNTTYFVVATFDGSSGEYKWSYATTETQTLNPTNNGWDIEYGHYKEDLPTPRAWASYADYKLVEIVFATALPVSLNASNVTATGATLTVANHNGDWWYEQAGSGGDNVCRGPVSGSSVTVSGLTAGTVYVYKAYSDSACTEANELAETTFTTLSYVTNLTSTKAKWGNHISSSTKQAIAFTTGSNAGGYTLKSVIVSLRNLMSGNSTLELKLYPMNGSTYSSTSAPGATAVANATFSGTPPAQARWTNKTWTDTTWTCSGSGCSLSKDTTYFIVATYSGLTSFNRYEAAYTTTEVQTTEPTNSGWDIEYGHYTDGGEWKSYSDYTLARFEFMTP